MVTPPNSRPAPLRDAPRDSRTRASYRAQAPGTSSPENRGRSTPRIRAPRANPQGHSQAQATSAFCPAFFTHQNAALPKFADCCVIPVHTFWETHRTFPARFVVLSLTLHGLNLQAPPPLLSFASILSCPTLPRAPEGFLTPMFFLAVVAETWLIPVLAVWALPTWSLSDMGARRLRNQGGTLLG